MADKKRAAAAEARTELISRLNGQRSMALVNADRHQLKRIGMAAAVAWRESRRCHCGALAFVWCAHRDAEIGAEHMPFPTHRTVAEIDELVRLRKAGL